MLYTFRPDFRPLALSLSLPEAEHDEQHLGHVSTTPQRRVSNPKPKQRILHFSWGTTTPNPQKPTNNIQHSISLHIYTLDTKETISGQRSMHVIHEYNHNHRTARSQANDGYIHDTKIETVYRWTKQKAT